MPEVLTFEETPNRAARQVRLETGVARAVSWEDAGSATPLAAALLKIPGVVAISAGPGFLTVRADGEGRWMERGFETSLLASLLDARLMGLSLQDDARERPGPDHAPEDADIVLQIEDLIEDRLRPSVEMDGGEISLVSFRDGVAKIALRGACSGCPSSAITMRMGVERLLRHYVPDVLRVEAI